MKHSIRATVKNVHWGYYEKSEPILKVNDGDTVEVFSVSGEPDIIELLGIENKIPKELKEIHEGLRERGPGPHILLGPISIREATPEDTLEITLLEVEPWVDFGINHFSPGNGTLPEDFPYLRAKYIPIDRKNLLGIFSENLKIPLRPFFGQLGVAPSSSTGRISSILPGPHGGNLDNKELVASSKVYLPINYDGALFSIGDGHLCQGDGEVDLTALETCMRGLIKLRVIKGVKIKWPMAESEKHFIIMGFNPDLDEALKMALRNAIEFLVSKGFQSDEAYMLCSLSVDFRITQVVNDVKGVHAMIPKELLMEKINSIF
jgi:acetamidase/formamidase